VLAFEPSPPTFLLLEKTARLNPGITAAQVALGEKTGVATLHLSTEPTNSGMTSLLDRTGTRGGEQVEVSVQTLDAVLAGEQRIAAMKIDVEGFELAVLAGGRRVFAEARPELLILEVANEPGVPAPADVEREVRRLGYADVRLVPDERFIASVAEIPPGVAVNLAAR
jgi:FkbM family methyltransferase